VIIIGKTADNVELWWTIFIYILVV
jgi:hypothetical protein